MSASYLSQTISVTLVLLLTSSDSLLEREEDSWMQKYIFITYFFFFLPAHESKMALLPSNRNLIAWIGI